MDETRLSRSGTTGPGGKLDRRVETQVDEQTEDLLAYMRVVTGKPKAEVHRIALEVGLEMMRSMHARMAQVDGFWRPGELPGNRG